MTEWFKLVKEVNEFVTVTITQQKYIRRYVFGLKQHLDFIRDPYLGLNRRLDLGFLGLKNNYLIGSY
jgi:hypothetical protein